MDEPNLNGEENQAEHFKKMLREEILIVVVAMVIYFVLVGIACVVNMRGVLRIVIVSIATVMLIGVVLFSLKLEQMAGYYECRKCKHKYIPKYSSVFFAMHINRTRYMKCPECQKWSWQKKVLRK